MTLKAPTTKDPYHFDLVVVGNVLGVLAVAVGAGSEGLRVLIVDEDQEVGGQAGSSSLIENYLGFPDGISGHDLASRAVDQARKFGVMFKSPFRATHIARADGGLITITADDHEKITCSAAVLATGVKYRRLEALNIGPFIGRGVSYGSPMTDAGKWENAKVAIVGGANSAAQAAVFLGGCNNCDVHLIVRGDSLAKGMSQYLVDNIDKAPNITVHLDTEVEEVLGNRDTISGIKVRNKAGVSKQIRLNHLFVQIGATPHTAWLDGEIALDEHGFIITDRDLANEQWPLEDRRPFTFETSVPGIFAVGDNRLHSVKRASAAVGEGSGVVPNIHAYLAQLRGLNGTH